MPHIVAVILTYNRKDLLERCLDAVQAQTYRCDSVIVVDNASSDGTQQMLREAGSRYPNLKVYQLSRNIGASGGFSAGFRLAYQDGADFVWMMDDDVIPRPDALQRLLEADERLERQGIERAFLLSTAFTESGQITNSPSLDVRPNAIRYPRWPETIELGMAPVRRATFVSILVPRAILTEFGLPIAAMFIWGEDTEFTLRVTRDKPGFLVGASKVLHLRQENGPIDILTETSAARLKYHRHLIRNNVFIARKYQQGREILSLFYGIFSLLGKLLRGGQLRKARVLLHGLAESLWFFPGSEAADAPIEALGVAVRAPEPTGQQADHGDSAAAAPFPNGLSAPPPARS